MARDSATDVRFEKMCRDAAIAAGFDPDERVNRVGEKPWPRWCEYKEEARKIMRVEKAERKAIEADAPPPYQPEQYKDAPLLVLGTHEENTLVQMKNCMSVGNVIGGVVCADGHLGYAVPIGGVIAYENQINISGVGFDIACGCYAAKLDIPYEKVKGNIPELLKKIKQEIPFGVGVINNTKINHDLFDDKEAWKSSDMEYFLSKARQQLGSCGSGNHYIDIMVDEAEQVWIGCHFGSRGLGHTIATKYLKMAGGKDGMHVPPAVVDDNSEIGQKYLIGMDLAGRYAYAGREWVIEKVREIMGGEILDRVHSHHNYAWKETHNGRDLWVVRKGATPAFPGQRGFVGGSMGDNAVIIEGVDSDKSKQAFYSTIHGAGRLFGRMQAKRTFTMEQMNDWLRKSGVTLLGGDLDESPMAYKRLAEVLPYHQETIKINHTLKPIGVIMAGSGDGFDPYKD
jgi:tRNA-splicing ligase RtcB